MREVRREKDKSLKKKKNSVVIDSLMKILMKDREHCISSFSVFSFAPGIHKLCSTTDRRSGVQRQSTTKEVTCLAKTDTETRVISI